jgi:hypothetical protein
MRGSNPDVELLGFTCFRVILGKQVCIRPVTETRRALGTLMRHR